MLQFVLGSYSRNGNRPSSHLNLGTLVEMLVDIASQGGGYNDVEKELLANYSFDTQKKAKKAAKQLKLDNFLSTYGYAVCHKVPYSSVEVALATLMEKTRVRAAAGLPASALDGAWAYFERFMLACYGNPHGWTQYYHTVAANLRAAVVAGQDNSACTMANDLMRDFDGASDNLFFGFGKTNSSISDNLDLHYNLNDPKPIVPATPRGGDIMGALNDLETALGLTTTKSIESLDVGFRWVMTSGAHGTKVGNTGYVATPL